MVLATGHSARDIYELLHRRGVRLEAKPFAMGVRIEHPQALIDSIQYHCESRGEYSACGLLFVGQPGGWAWRLFVLYVAPGDSSFRR